MASEDELDRGEPWPLRQLWRGEFEAVCQIVERLLVPSRRPAAELHALALALLVLRRLPRRTPDVEVEVSLLRSGTAQGEELRISINAERLAFSRVIYSGFPADAKVDWNDCFVLTPSEAPASIVGLRAWVDAANMDEPFTRVSADAYGCLLDDEEAWRDDERGAAWGALRQ